MVSAFWAAPLTPCTQGILRLLAKRSDSYGSCGSILCRHPPLGNRVQIGAFASVLGAIHVGDGAFIGPGCIITKDVPAAARVQIKTSLQVVLEP